MPALAKLPILRIDEALTDFADTAAVIGELDLVIAVDTAVAHLAGAMGKPLWLLVSHIQDWRWLRDRTDSPWYPSARLFRQPQIGDWDGVIAAVAQELAGFAKACAADQVTQVNFPPDWASMRPMASRPKQAAPRPAPRLYLMTPPIADASVFPCN